MLELQQILTRPAAADLTGVIQALEKLTAEDQTVESWLSHATKTDLEKLICLLATTGEWQNQAKLLTCLKVIQKSWIKPAVPAVATIPGLIETFSGDAERAFLSVYPVGADGDAQLNPGALYLQLRQNENPAHRKKEADLLAAQADQLLANLEKWSLETLRVLQQQVPRMGDRETRFRRQRDLALQMAWDYPRALHALKGTVATLHQQKSLDGLKAVKFFLIRAEKEWITYSRRLRETPPHPLNLWCARVREMQALAEAIRRGLAV
ncbi:hypothetical protein A6M27_10060 [Acidithiobacillus thiooxidans]|uniref:Uncharacterized protein n=1 Tax=Acidithiobacillus thiooxidans TaxID=930 RepID=A0A1C2JC76_ACITH|nr:hypothetical protein [Acidithiobacillus thiooxidans]OCX67971.1 hypothetical protein A6P07_19050 [Acidithiobacillus thiooxidans]OCX71102.1 hypothetical protein A6O24_15810 [Acidithiobacillus thiooxidans]OCX85814.1 hypothetical protein A6O26_00285 [Acidithiobacillus thiooxidans]OCX87818.1 hypothetical protein A6M27_10060 [Acidithiobacillus thiooxidans]OFC48546.1 hypothetical protein BAE47_07595 [Acidithiobacillus thiooxidans]